jgi:hydrogenase maturation protein HypF
MNERARAVIEGVVQGVGFRPFVARLAQRLELAGFVRNTQRGVVVEVEGGPASVRRFRDDLKRHAPAAASLEIVSWSALTPIGAETFDIEASTTGGQAAPSCAPDLALCGACKDEVDDPAGRRFAYPFTTCTACGPRFTIAERLPWDRARTSMASFELCADCRSEYEAPSDRRYHAEPIACPRCGPSLRLEDADGSPVAGPKTAIDAAVEAIGRGDTVAVLGLGGFQLLVDATSDAAVARLRDRKGRDRKPFAVMVPTLQAAERLARIDPFEARALTSPAGPIVLLHRRDGGLSRHVAPHLHRVGLLLPTTPLHHLLLTRFGGPVVATSGNRHDDPIVIDPRRGRTELRGIADVFLVHDRPVVHRCDDSVIQVVAGTLRVLRAARGYRPRTFRVPRTPNPILAVGGHLKAAPAIAFDGQLVAWPHVGDLHSAGSRAAFAQAVEGLEAWSGVRAERVAVDAHPDYASTQFARSRGSRIEVVHHHHAHIAAVLAEHGESAALGFAWDGVGMGPDGSAWGGEALDVDRAHARRVAHLRPFPLPGADAAARDGRRALAGLLESAGLPLPGGSQELTRLRELARRPSLCTPTTSIGRLFDAVAALVGVADRSRYEAEAAIRLEQLADRDAVPYDLPCSEGQLDWRPMLAAMIRERDDPTRVASRFHATLAHALVAVAQRHRATVVALGGGCFHNARLLEMAHARLASAGIRVLSPSTVPAGDGGLAVGQAWIAGHRYATVA